MNFQIKNFDGPLELLLTLIHNAQIEIKDIFVSSITDQYIAYIHSEAFLDMEDATEFLVMAATLLEIKSRAMLPKPPKLEEGEEDPEEALIRRLEEYKAFRETAGAMKEFENAAGHIFSKLPDEFPLPPQETELVGLNLDALLAALNNVLSRKPAQESKPEVNHYKLRDIHRDEHNVQECMLDILTTVKKAKRVRFEDIFSDTPTKEEVVTYFMALLELLRLGEMHAEQTQVGGEIYLISGRKPEEEIPVGSDDDEQIPRRKGRGRRIEAILFVVGEPVLVSELSKALSVDLKKLNHALKELKDEYDFQQRGFSLRFFGSHVQLTTRELYSEDVVHLLQPVQRQTLSQAMMETLAVVAYKQPVTKADVEQIRGVKCDYSVATLVNKGLICEVGRKETLGRPILYGTTDQFLQHFGISSLEDLPPMPVQKESVQEESQELEGFSDR